uniref:PawS derived peptide 21 n=1 Tax=Zinnia haageana TaxID=1525732 RepID=A0A1C7D043_9ASTR|nr:Chain A, PawS derived peptide 21 [Zinnia haageana]
GRPCYTLQSCFPD